MNNFRTLKKYSGSKETIDSDGVCERTIIVQPKKQDLNFIKLFLPPKGQYQMYPKEMTLASRQLFEYFYVVADKHNIVLAPMSEITERTELSSASIARAKSQLFEMGFIKQRANNIFMINPSRVYKGESESRFDAYEEYESIKQKDTNNKSSRSYL